MCISWIWQQNQRLSSLYDTSRSKVIHSRDVSFDESTRGFEIEKESVKDEEPQVVPLGGMEQTIDDDSNHAV